MLNNKETLLLNARLYTECMVEIDSIYKDDYCRAPTDNHIYAIRQDQEKLLYITRLVFGLLWQAWSDRQQLETFVGIEDYILLIFCHQQQLEDYSQLIYFASFWNVFLKTFVLHQNVLLKHTSATVKKDTKRAALYQVCLAQERLQKVWISLGESFCMLAYFMELCKNSSQITREIKA